MVKEMIEVVLDDHKEEIFYEIEYTIAQAGDEYADTFRSTPLEDKYPTKEEAEHHNTKRSCCGRSDWVYKTYSGHYYLVGYNYGH